MNFYTSAQLAASAGISARTLGTHLREKWLKPEPKIPGARGHRFSERTAKSWISRYYPGKKLIGSEVAP